MVKLHTLSAPQRTCSSPNHIPRTSGFRISFVKVSEGRDKMDNSRPSKYVADLRRHEQVKSECWGISAQRDVWGLSASVEMWNVVAFLGAFIKLCKATIRFVMSVRLCVCPHVTTRPVSQWADFHEIWNLNIFRKSVMKIRVSLKSDQNNGTSHADRHTFLNTSRSILLRVQSVSDKF